MCNDDDLDKDMAMEAIEQVEPSMDAEEAEEIDKIKLVKITARINEAVSDVIKDIAEEYGVSFSEVVRLSIDGHLYQYLGGVRYVEKDQSEKMFRQRMEIVNGIQGVRNELNWIGVNVNQIAKCNNIAAQIIQLRDELLRARTRTEQDELLDKIKKLESYQSAMTLDNFSSEDMERCMEQFQKSADLMGRILWRIPW